MEVSGKDAARSKFKLTQRHKQGRGGGRGGRGSSSTPSSGHKPQDSNYDRYSEEAEPEAGVPVRQSHGADLEALLQEAQAQDSATLYRHQVELDGELEDLPPPVAGQRELAIDLKGLAACLSQLPLHEVLGIESKYLAELDDGDGNAPPPARQAAAAKPAFPTSPPPQQQQQRQQHANERSTEAGAPEAPEVPAPAQARAPEHARHATGADKGPAAVTRPAADQKQQPQDVPHQRPDPEAPISDVDGNDALRRGRSEAAEALSRAGGPLGDRPGSQAGRTASGLLAEAQLRADEATEDVERTMRDPLDALLGAPRAQACHRHAGPAPPAAASAGGLFSSRQALATSSGRQVPAPATGGGSGASSLEGQVGGNDGGMFDSPLLQIRPLGQQLGAAKHFAASAADDELDALLGVGGREVGATPAAAAGAGTLNQTVKKEQSLEDWLDSL